MLLNTPICDFGAPAPDFSLATPDGVTHSKDGLMGENGLLVAFICNHCPYVIAIIERLVADIKILQGQGIGVACIMSNNWATHGLTAPYLVDADQSVGHAYGAVCTPDFFGYNAQGALQYRGRLDDAAMGDPTGRVPELLNAMRQVAETGKGPQDQTPSMGCSIKWR